MSVKKAKALIYSGRALSVARMQVSQKAVRFVSLVRHGVSGIWANGRIAKKGVNLKTLLLQ